MIFTPYTSIWCIKKNIPSSRLSPLTLINNRFIGWFSSHIFKKPANAAYNLLNGTTVKLAGGTMLPVGKTLLKKNNTNRKQRPNQKEIKEQ